MELVQEHFVNWEQAKLQPNSPMLQLTVKDPALKTGNAGCLYQKTRINISIRDNLLHESFERKTHVMLTSGIEVCRIV